ncbi:MAG: deoxyribose-phosphate aldolase [Bacteroidota bacterium]
MNFPELPFQPGELPEKVARFATIAGSMGSPDMLKLAFSCIDLTTLNSTDTVSGVAAFTQKVNAFGLQFPGAGNVAAICVYPNMASVVRENLAVDSVGVAAVAGGFPSSMTFLSLKEEEARLAVVHGADEIDIVLPLWAFLEENYEYCMTEVRAIKNTVGDAHLKVILESGALKDPELIWKASLLSLEAGADFIKTSTGKMPVAATPEAAIIMSYALKYWYDKTGERRGFKPAGGIVSTADAMLYCAIVGDILGEEWMNNKLFRIGASRLANNLLTDINGKETSYF